MSRGANTVKPFSLCAYTRLTRLPNWGSFPTVKRWLDRYEAGGLAGLGDRPRRGRPRTSVTAEVVRRTLEEDRPSGTHWSTRLMAPAAIRRPPSLLRSRTITLFIWSNRSSPGTPPKKPKATSRSPEERRHVLPLVEPKPQQPRVAEHDQKQVAAAPRETEVGEVHLALTTRLRLEPHQRLRRQRGPDLADVLPELRVAAGVSRRRGIPPPGSPPAAGPPSTRGTLPAVPARSPRTGPAWWAPGAADRSGPPRDPGPAPRS
ncbi:helix-turn-helix domain-containing protein [Candidatus Palauibacter sp.]|uniref:helix-turn-helix domain-containing protein n=1 Tax=Candidatus Palauibacter sp. TaxID=3101350 RepID=UPI003B52933C